MGPGLREAIYEEAMCHELSQSGLSFTRQESVAISYKGVKLSTPLRLDLVIEGALIVDNKSKSVLTPLDSQQLLSYLRLTGIKLGLLINFNGVRLTDGLRRVVNGLAD